MHVSHRGRSIGYSSVHSLSMMLDIFVFSLDFPFIFWLAFFCKWHWLCMPNLWGSIFTLFVLFRVNVKVSGLGRVGGTGAWGRKLHLKMGAVNQSTCFVFLEDTHLSQLHILVMWSKERDTPLAKPWTCRQGQLLDQVQDYLHGQAEQSVLTSTVHCASLYMCEDLAPGDLKCPGKRH